MCTAVAPHKKMAIDPIATTISGTCQIYHQLVEIDYTMLRYPLAEIILFTADDEANDDGMI